MSSRTEVLVLDQRTQQILDLLPYADRPEHLERRLRAFLSVNGFGPVLEAARQLAAKRGPVADPWTYLVNSVNREQARGNLFAVLAHWVENALRTKVDVTLSAAVGPNWHLDFRNFVPARHFGRGNLPATWFSRIAVVQAPIIGRQPDPAVYPDPESFLRATTLGDLHAILSVCLYELDSADRLRVFDVECTYTNCIPYGATSCCASPHRHSSGRALRMGNRCREWTIAVAAGATVPENRVLAMVNNVRDARNDVSHSRKMSSNLSIEAFRDARHLLAALGFDLVKATQRVERARVNAAHVMLQEFGVPDGYQVVLNRS